MSKNLKKGFLSARLPKQEGESSGTDAEEIKSNQLSEARDNRKGKKGL